MSLVIPTAGEDVMLQNVLNKTAPQEQTLKLFVNNIAPSLSDTEATYTEAFGFGYAAIALAHANWTITQGNPTVAAYSPAQVFNFTGALGLVYGYYVVQTVSGKILWAERFINGPFNVLTSADSITITLQLTARNAA